jgi:glutaminase
VSTGQLPPAELVWTLVAEAHDRFKSVADGKYSDVYPALVRVPSDLFGLCVVGTSGNVYAVGDAEHEFTIMSVSKPFVFALVCEALGHEEARRKLGVNSTGLPFNSLEAIERSGDGRTNPMVNSGAIATTSLVPGTTSDARWRFIHEGLSRFAGRTLAITRKSTPPQRPPTSATRASPDCSRPTTGSTWIRPRRPSSTPDNAR